MRSMSPSDMLRIMFSTSLKNELAIPWRSSLSSSRNFFWASGLMNSYFSRGAHPGGKLLGQVVELPGVVGGRCSSARRRRRSSGSCSFASHSSMRLPAPWRRSRRGARGSLRRCSTGRSAGAAVLRWSRSCLSMSRRPCMEPPWGIFMPRDSMLRMAQRRSPYSIRSSASWPRISSASRDSFWLPSHLENCGASGRCAWRLPLWVSRYRSRSPCGRTCVSSLCRCRPLEDQLDRGRAPTAGRHLAAVRKDVVERRQSARRWRRSPPAGVPRRSPPTSSPANAAATDSRSLTS